MPRRSWLEQFNVLECRETVPINIVLGLALSKEPQGLCQMIVQSDSFMSELADKKVLLFDFFLKWAHPFQFFLGS